MRRVVPFLALAVAIFATACGDNQPTSPRLSPGQPSNFLSDGSQQGNEDFFFLPPIAPNPSSNETFDAGRFNPNLRPVVKICLLVDEDIGPAVSVPKATTSCDGEPIESISTSEVRVADEMYQVVWHTGQDNLNPDRYYRIQVYAGSERLGFADVTVATSKAEARSAITNEVFPLNADRSMPIKFRIELGAFGACKIGNPDCAEVSVTPAGGTFFTSTRFAAVQLEDGWARADAFEAGGGTILLTIQRDRQRDGNCHVGEGSDSRLYTELSGCYHYTTFPDLDDFGGFQTDGNKVAQCSTGLDGLTGDDYLLFKSDPGEPLQWLHDVAAPAGLNCENFAFYEGLPSNSALRFAALGWRSAKRAVGRAVGVKVAYAYDGGLGGLLLGGDGFSFISRGKAARKLAVEGDVLQSAIVGQKVPTDPKIRLVSVHRHKNVEGEPQDEAVAGEKVIFRASEGGHLGSATGLAVAEVTTDENGYASIPWFPAAGQNTLSVEFNSVVFGEEEHTLQLAGSLTFRATGIVNGSISGTVSSSRGLINEGQVRLVSTVDEEFTPRSTAIDDGEYSFTDLPAGTYAVSAATIGFNIARQVVPLDPGENRVVHFLLSPTGGITGIVTNEQTGAAIAGASVSLVGSTGGVVTNASGTFGFGNLHAGTYRLRTTFPNFTPDERDVVVGTDQALVTIPLRSIPDLAVTQFTFEPAQPTTADRVVYTVIVSNLGGTDAPESSATLNEGFSATRNGSPVIGGSVNPDIPIPAIPAGKNVTLTLSAVDFGGGPMSRSASFTVNTGAPPVPDGNGGNNRRSISFNVVEVIGSLMQAISGALNGI